jgi:hypothetical protein
MSENQYNDLIAAEQQLPHADDFLEEITGEIKTNAPQIRALHAGDIKRKPKSFLWKPFIPKRELTLLFGNQGTGKSTAATVIGAELSRGKRPLSDRSYEPIKVLYISSEEEACDIFSRFVYSNANTDNVGIYDRDLNDQQRIDITHRPDELTALIKAEGAQFVIFDVMHNFIGAGSDHDLNSSEFVSSALIKLTQIARECDCSIMMIEHPRKGGSDDDANFAVAGSAEFTRKPRSVIKCIYDETGTDPDRRVLVQTKSNASKLAPSVAFRIVAFPAETPDDPDDETEAPYGAVFVDYSVVTREIIERAAAERKKICDYLDAHPVEAPSRNDTAAKILADLADHHLVNGEVTTRYAKKWLVQQYPNAFQGQQLPTLIEQIRPKLSARGYYIEYTKQVFDRNGIKDYSVEVTRKEKDQHHAEDLPFTQ